MIYQPPCQQRLCKRKSHSKNGNLQSHYSSWQSQSSPSNPTSPSPTNRKPMAQSQSTLQAKHSVLGKNKGQTSPAILNLAGLAQADGNDHTTINGLSGALLIGSTNYTFSNGHGEANNHGSTEIQARTNSGNNKLELDLNGHMQGNGSIVFTQPQSKLSPLYFLSLSGQVTINLQSISTTRTSKSYTHTEHEHRNQTTVTVTQNQTVFETVTQTQNNTQTVTQANNQTVTVTQNNNQTIIETITQSGTNSTITVTATTTVANVTVTTTQT